MSSNGEEVEEQEYVDVTEDYSYSYRGRANRIYRNERYLVFKKSKEWWLIISLDGKTIWAPCMYLRPVKITTQEKKETLKALYSKSANAKTRALRDENYSLHGSIRHNSIQSTGSSAQNSNVKSGNPSSSNNNYYYSSQVNRGSIPVGSIKKRDISNPIPNTFTHTKINPEDLKRGLKFTKDDISGPVDFLCNNSGKDVAHSSFKPNSYAKLNSNVNNMQASINSNRSSRLSLYDSSGCSSDSLEDILEGVASNGGSSNGNSVKSNSFDGAISDVNVLHLSDQKSSRTHSEEKLDSRKKTFESNFLANQLSYRNRSNSMDFKALTKENIKDGKYYDVDKSSKERTSWRRSLVLEETASLKQYKPLRGSDDLDVSLVLDNPPKLPPKQKKLEKNNNDSIKLLKNQKETFKRRSLDLPGSHLSVTSERSSHIPSKNEQISFPDNNHSLGPVKQHKQNTPPIQKRESSLRHKNYNSSKKNQNEGPPDVLPRTIYAPASGLPPQYPNAMERSNTCIGGFGLPSDDQLSVGSVDSLGKDKSKELKRSFKEKSTSSSRKGSIRGFFSRSSSNDSKDSKPPSPIPQYSSDEKLISKLPKHPPSPKLSQPTRELTDGWSEYWFAEFKCPYYYNRLTGEKRWKPPRKMQLLQDPQLQNSLSFRQAEFRASRNYSNNSKSTVEVTSIPPPTAFKDSPQIVTTPVQDNFTIPIQDNTARSRVPVQPLTTLSPDLLFERDPKRESTRQFVLPPRPPPNAAKPPPKETLVVSTSIGLSASSLSKAEGDKVEALLSTLETHCPPDGWIKKISKHQPVYVNLVNGEKWLATTTGKGEVYFYNTETNESLWELPPTTKKTLAKSASGCDSEDEEGLASLDGEDTSTSSPPPSSPRLPDAQVFDVNDCKIVASGYITRTFYQKKGKKVRKNWASVHAKYLVRLDGNFASGSRSLLLFAKSPTTKINPNKVDMFDLLPPCSVEYGKDKTSQKGALCLTNGHQSELLLKAPEEEIGEWLDAFRYDNAVTYKVVEEKETSKEDLKRENSNEKLSAEQWKIRDKLLGFIKRRPHVETLVKKGVYQDAVFGSTISVICSKDKTNIPVFVLKCINAIENPEENLKQDGLYRISGNAAQIQKIRFEVAQNNYQVLAEEKDVNNLTGALKLFFRELKEPLLTFSTYSAFIKGISENRKEGKQLEALQKAVKALPLENFSTLKVLLEHLIRVYEFSSSNRMNFMNLAIVFGPCLLWPDDTTGHDLMTDVMLHNRVVESLLTHYDKCVGNIKR